MTAEITSEPRKNSETDVLTEQTDLKNENDQQPDKDPSFFGSIIGYLTGFSFYPQKTAVRYFQKRSNLRTFGPILVYGLLFSFLSHLGQPLETVNAKIVVKDILVIYLISIVGSLVYFLTAKLSGGLGTFKDTIMAVSAGIIPLCAYSFISFALHFLKIYSFPMIINLADLAAGAFFVFISVAASVFALKEAHDLRHAFQFIGMLFVSFINILIFNFIYSLSYLYFLK